MNYVPFLKARYKENNIEKIYKQVFSSSDTIHLDFKIHDHPAFIVPCAEVYKNMLAIHKINTEVCLLRRSLPGVAVSQFARRCLIDEIVLTNDIEGVSSTRREIGDVLDQANGRKSLHFLGMVNKYQKLQENVTVSIQSCGDIRALYDELVLDAVLAENRKNAPDGKIFRKDSVSVESKTDKEIHRGIYPESEIISAMESALFFLNNDKLEPLIRIAGFHYLFGYIHPFYDGNGRISRFISSYLLSRELDPLIGYRLSYTMKEHIHDYYSAFKTCNDNRNMGDITPFVITFLEILLEAMEQLRNALHERNEQLKLYDKALREDFILGSEKNYSLSDLLLQASLFSEDGINTKELLTVLEISRTTLKDRLQELDAYNYVISHKEGRVIYYKLNLGALQNK